MTKHVDEHSRDAVLNEKKQPQRHVIPQQSQRDTLWEKVVGYFALSHRPEPRRKQTVRRQKLNVRRDQNDLELIFTKLKDCCDERETDLKEAIKYGLKIISAGKRLREDSKTERRTEPDGSSRDSAASGSSSSRETQPPRQSPLT